MENRLLWKDSYNIGIDLIDREHKKLFHILHKLFDFGRQEEKSHWACREAVKFFKDYTREHFADEETYMESIRYEGLETHKRIHTNFRDRTLPALEKELERDNYSKRSVVHFLGVCASWLVGHILGEDQLIVSGEPVVHWQQLLPEEKQIVMGQTIAGLLHSMFQIEPRLISNCYGGERFGDGIYCRLIYHLKLQAPNEAALEGTAQERTAPDGTALEEKKKLEFILIFEEQIVASVIGSVIDVQSEAVNNMLVKVAMYMARQIVERVMRYFPPLGQVEGEEEQGLTYEQFQRVWEKQSPQFSMLFDTGEGYFAYCVATTNTLQNEDGVSILTGRAMAEIEKHMPRTCDWQENGKRRQMAQKEAENKKKLLVVDDSDFVCMAMQKLLGDDYEVATAKSGLSAISSITLARPDLILLDYEMPVCNGRQVLEMIRSEQEFTDIPVIFLTNKADQESVRKAIALKPEGYLVKSLSTESVKKEVDLFFEKSSLGTKREQNAKL